MLIAHVLNGKAHHIFDAPSLPIIPNCPANMAQLFAPLVPTNAKEGWLYNSGTGIFSPPANYVAPPAYLATRTRRFLNNGIFIVPEDVTEIRVTACGGGGGGGFSNVGPAGGGGAAIFKQAFPVTPGMSIPITIGSSGLGQRESTSASYLRAPSSGGATVIGSLITLGGGGCAAMRTSYTSLETGFAGGTGGGQGGENQASTGSISRYSTGGKGQDGIMGCGGSGGGSMLSVGAGIGSYNNYMGATCGGGGSLGGGGGAGDCPAHYARETYFPRMFYNSAIGGKSFISAGGDGGVGNAAGTSGGLQGGSGGRPYKVCNASNGTYTVPEVWCGGAGGGGAGGGGGGMQNFPVSGVTGQVTYGEAGSGGRGLVEISW